MEFWSAFWGIVFCLTLGVYSLLVVIVGIGGFSDIKSMLTSLDEQEESNKP